LKGDYQPIGVVVAVAGSVAYAVHHLHQREIKRIHDKAATEIKRIHDKAATEIAQAKADVARVEGERKVSEEFLKAEVERYKQELQLAHTEDYKPYQTAISKKKEKRGGTGGPQKEEEKD
jgi:hypothetical protein